MPSLVEENAYLVRFTGDSQGCGAWYLYLGSDGSRPVVCDALCGPVKDDTPEPIDVRSFLAAMMWVTPNFEQFLYRYWIENVAWYEVVDQERPWHELTPTSTRLCEPLPAAGPSAA